ncbi:SMI1/KNR4 family protein [Streptomyces sp. NPDC087428]|uniref:SMI1/KNR4 family protein n=1 Tax=Streptomyces sp. NPDC087428 TaxID=3365788 RepID=UPI00380A8CC2
MWQELISPWLSTLEVGEPAGEADLYRAESILGHPLPSVLRQLLVEFDGVADEYGTDVVWSTQQIADSNLEFRNSGEFAELYAPFDRLLFFGDNGGGDQFALQVGALGDEVLVWDHETDERSVVAPSLPTYVSQALASDGGDWYR